MPNTSNIIVDGAGTPIVLSSHASLPLVIGTSGTGALKFVSNNLGGMEYKLATATVVGAAAATISATNLIPAGSLVLGVTILVTSTFSNASLTSMTIGDGSDADRWGALIGLTAGTQTTGAAFTGTQPAFFASATSVVITGTGANFAANGSLVVRAYYLSFPGV